MSQLFKTYDPEKFAIAYSTPTAGGTIALNSGIADGTFIEVDRDEDAYMAVAGAAGDVGRAKNANRMGEVTLTLMQNSPVNKELMRLALQDEQIGDVIGSLRITDPSDPTGSFLVNARNTWIKKIPTLARGKEYSDGNMVWTFQSADLQINNDVTLSLDVNISI